MAWHPRSKQQRLAVLCLRHYEFSGPTTHTLHIPYGQRGPSRSMDVRLPPVAVRKAVFKVLLRVARRSPRQHSHNRLQKAIACTLRGILSHLR